MTIGKKALGIGGAVVIAVLIAGYFLLLSPKSTSVRLTVAQASIASTDSESVSGSVSPAASGRLVIVEVGGGNSWSEVARTSTDSTGVYKAAFPLTELGKKQIRVRVETDGRQKAATSKAQTVSVLSPTQLNVTLPEYARTDRPLRISGRIGPAAIRTVTLEQSADGQDWTTAGSGSSKVNGQFTVAATGFAAGSIQLRVVVAASDSEAQATSEAQSVAVEDYQTAGKRYLAIVEPANKLLDEFNASLDKPGLSVSTSVAKKLSAAYTKEARRFRAYAYWPQEVKAPIELLAKSSILRADYFNQLARTKTIAEFAALDYPTGPKGADDAPAIIRAALGLPKRG